MRAVRRTISNASSGAIASTTSGRLNERRQRLELRVEIHHTDDAVDRESDRALVLANGDETIRWCIARNADERGRVENEKRRTAHDRKTEHERTRLRNAFDRKRTHRFDDMLEWDRTQA